MSRMSENPDEVAKLTEPVGDIKDKSASIYPY